MNSVFNSFGAGSEAGNRRRLRVEGLKHRVEPRDRQQILQTISDSSQSDAIVSPLSGLAFSRFKSIVYVFLGGVLCLPHHFGELADQEPSSLPQRLALAKREHPLLAQVSQ